MSAVITIDFVVPVGYQAGDYARLHGNGGSGSIDWNNPLSSEIFELFPRGIGICGWGRAPWGHFRWGRAHSMRTLGWGHLPWGRFPWGRGTAWIKAQHKVETCGEYKFGFASYDKAGNPHQGTPDEVTVHVHIAPAAPTGLTKVSYNKETDVLVLAAA
ncbi:MAG: hypothetical protein ACYS21_02870 [Planctomycetota bacterium]|jgi:hypothetical protein